MALAHEKALCEVQQKACAEVARITEEVAAMKAMAQESAAEAQRAQGELRSVMEECSADKALWENQVVSLTKMLMSCCEGVVENKTRAAAASEERAPGLHACVAELEHTAVALKESVEARV